MVSLISTQTVFSTSPDQPDFTTVLLKLNLKTSQDILGRSSSMLIQTQPVKTQLVQTHQIHLTIPSCQPPELGPAFPLL